MKLSLEYLSSAEIDTLHEAALKTLQDVGMRFPSPKALTATVTRTPPSISRTGFWGNRE